VDKSGIISHVLCSLNDNYRSTRSHHDDSALLVCDTGIIVTYHQEGQFVCYLEAYIRNVERSLREWRLNINVSKGIEIFYSKLADV